MKNLINVNNLIKLNKLNDLNYQTLFEDFLIDNGKTIGTINSYKSNVKNAFEKYLNHPVIKNDHRIISLINYKSRMLLIEILLGKLKEEINYLKSQDKGFKTAYLNL